MGEAKRSQKGDEFEETLCVKFNNCQDGVAG